MSYQLKLFWQVKRQKSKLNNLKTTRRNFTKGGWHASSINRTNPTIVSNATDTGS